MTANPKRLIIMCYEGAIENLKISKQKYIEQDYEGRSRALSKAQDIINELLCALDFEKGGTIAMSLDSLYSYMLRRIIHADVNKDVTPIDEVIDMLSELKSAWEEVLYKPGKEIKPEATGYEGETRQQAQIL
jgi:flagellar protein FliS